MTPYSHPEAQDALPWLANGTLAGTELERAQAHVATCADCRADLALLRTLHAAGPGPELDLDPERALARLMPRLDTAPVDDDVPMPCAVPTAPTAQAAQKMPEAQEAPGLLQRWRMRRAANDGTWLRAAVAAQFCAIAVLAALLARPAAQPDAGAYRVLGAAGASGAARLVVTFRPDTPERELHRILRASGARIVGGPTVTDAWLVGADGRLDPVLARLRAEPAVTLAEPLSMDGQP
ncbi:zf-HC2 domain-containing protein [Massilia rhizosphaerae]|uniref:zf-HC2 domain-containing protein n=1 Tax=Massilia rhizosphaerae TaxID=2784389 RepID=UPI0018DBF5B1|nr:zf-HC2 domain-containing protein [Massilia rhizosphaerae]